MPAALRSGASVGDAGAGGDAAPCLPGVANEQARGQVIEAAERQVNDEAGERDEQAEPDLIAIARGRGRWVREHEEGEEEGGVHVRRAEEFRHPRRIADE